MESKPNITISETNVRVQGSDGNTYTVREIKPGDPGFPKMTDEELSEYLKNKGE